MGSNPTDIHNHGLVGGNKPPTAAGSLLQKGMLEPSLLTELCQLDQLDLQRRGPTNRESKRLNHSTPPSQLGQCRAYPCLKEVLLMSAFLFSSSFLAKHPNGN